MAGLGASCLRHQAPAQEREGACQPEAMKDADFLKLLALPGAVLILVGIGFAYGQSASCARAEGQAPREWGLVAAGLMLSGTTAALGYRSGLSKRSD